MPLIALVLLLFMAAFGGCQDTPTVPEPPLTYDTPPIPEQGLHVVVDEPDRMFIEQEPFIVAGGGAHFIYTDSIRLDLGGRTVRQVFVFHGLDRGDLVEQDTEIYIDSVPVFLRSEHKENTSAFDSWVSEDINLAGQTARVSVRCGVTGVNTIMNRFAARPHWGIWMTFE